MADWLFKITTWLIDLVKSILGSLATIIGDAVVWVASSVLGVVGDLIVSLPTPTFMTGNTLGTILGGLPPFALYVINQMSFGAAFAMIAAGVSFNLLRKIFTLGQW